MNIGNERIKENLAKNCGQLEHILEADSAECKKTACSGYGKKITSQKDAENIFKEAKASIDSLLSIEEMCSVKIIMGSKAYGHDKVITSSYISNGIFVAAGIMLAKFGNNALFDCVTIGGLMAGLGLIRLVRLMSIKRQSNNPEFFPAENSIYCPKEKSKKMEFGLMLAYSSAAVHEDINNSPEYRCMNYGLLLGISGCAAMSDDNALKHLALKRSTDMLETAVEALRRKEENKYLKAAKNIAAKAFFANPEEKELAALGYSFFRLAEEKQGKSIYKQALEGNTAILFQ